MKICKIKWSSDYDETKIIFTDDFYESSSIVKLDVLKDVMRIIENKYNNILINDYLK